MLFVVVFIAQRSQNAMADGSVTKSLSKRIGHAHSKANVIRFANLSKNY
jgi:hypothetical protein